MQDGVPVLWHDDDVVYGSPESPLKPRVQDLTLAEFQATNEPPTSLLRLFQDGATRR